MCSVTKRPKVGTHALLALLYPFAEEAGLVGLATSFPWHAPWPLPFIPPSPPLFIFLFERKRKSIALKKKKVSNLLSTYYVPGTILRTENIAVKQTSMSQGRTELVFGLPGYAHQPLSKTHCLGAGEGSVNNPSERSSSSSP